MAGGDKKSILKLGRLTLDMPFFQAALSGYSDYAMRRLAIDYGAPLVFAGVMLAKTATYPRVLNKIMFKPRDDEHPIGAQILGTEPKVMTKAARELVTAGYDLIDLNFACPAPKVLRRGRGGYLLNEPEKVMNIYRAVRDSVDCPVLMKLRIGFGKSSRCRDNFWKIASQASADGIDALVVHGRSVKERYTGSADWGILAELKRNYSSTTIIGSGDIFDAEVTAGRLKATALDGAVIARGAIGNPWIFRDLRAIMRNEPLPQPPGLSEQAGVILRHFEMVKDLYGQFKAVGYIRKFLVHYCKLHPERKKAQKNLLAAKNHLDLLETIKRWYMVN